MASISKRVSGSWVSGDYGIMKTATDTITTLPAVLYPTGTTATVGLKGQTVQSGTPTTQNPVMPNGCGERTSNWFDYQQTQGITDNCFINQNGQIVSNGEYYISYPIYVTSGETYTWQFNKREADGRHTSPTVGCYDANDNLISVAQHAATVINFVFTTPQNCAYIKCSVYKKNNLQTQAQLNVGSSVLPYEPYGYKLAISSASTTTPVYLGEVQTTRRVKKLVLTGEEDWQLQSVNQYGIANIYIRINASITGSFVSHYKQQNTLISQTTEEGYLLIANSGGNQGYFYIRTTEQTVADFKIYLAQQYAAGTPVTLWYVLATETTGIVNEPLMRIGNYADEVSNVSIPVTAGGDTLSVGTTVQPSEVTANYHGWHNGAVKDYENGDWQPQVQALSLSNAPMLSNSLMAFPDMSEPEIEPETTE